MFCFIKNNRFDCLVNKVLMTNYFIYQFALVFACSAIRSTNSLLYLIDRYAIKTSFVIVSFVLLFKIFRGLYNKLEIFLCFIFGIIFLLSYKRCHDGMLIVDMIYILSFKDLNYKSVIKTYIISTALCFLLNLTTGLIFNLQGDRILSRSINDKIIIRNNLGFNIPPFCAHFFYAIVLAIILYFEKLDIIKIVFLFIINVIIFYYTDTKSPFICVCFALLSLLLFYKSKNSLMAKAYTLLCMLSVPLGLVLTTLVAYLYNPNNIFFSIINRFLTGRLGLMNRNILFSGINFWGITKYYDGGGYNVVDSAYLSILLFNGIAVTIVFSLFILSIVFFAYKNNKFFVVIAVFAVSLHSLVDTGYTSIQFNPCIFLFYPMLREYFMNYKNEH